MGRAAFARIGLLLGLMAVLGGLAACVPTVRSQVEVFHDLDRSYRGGTIAIVAGDDTKTDDLEFRNFAVRLSRRLSAAGFTVVPADEPHDYVAQFDYGVDNGELVVETYSVPTYGFRRYSGFHGYYPRYSVIGYRTRTRRYTVFTRELGLTIWRDQAGGGTVRQQVYSAAVTSRGTCGSLVTVIDEMLAAAFQDFPGESSSVRTVDIELSQTGCR